MGEDTVRASPNKWRRDLMKELKKVSYLAAPMLTTEVLQYLLQVVSVMMVGHLGQTTLPGVAIATSLTNVTGFSLLTYLIHHCSLKWWSLEILILLSGLLPNPKLETSVLSICLTISVLHLTIPYGLGVAARFAFPSILSVILLISQEYSYASTSLLSSTRVSNELGAGNPDKAQVVVWAVMFLAVTETITISILLFCCRHILGRAYSNEEQVVDYIALMTPLICASAITDSLQAVISGIARGSGWQHICAYVNLGAFYLLGIPAAAVLGFTLHLKAKGLWIGIVIGSALQATVLSVITGFRDWQKQAMKARERVTEGSSLEGN
ncbi:hypothetical protein CDL12_06600 [Handroanthus impetiginosus]|uniref:Uncharacterized protein n=1 Tax=Handroanthus impetiginosus TaxID=429701 RepID=A0A2G9HT64_9LAMI|nr:hypothetical protein CDL12_06600 [Handroanthus impetiginosus]